MLLIFILLIFCTAEIIFSKLYTQIQGQYLINDFALRNINFQNGQKLVISISDYDLKKIPLLMVCESLPNFQEQPQLIDLQNNACLADLNSFDLSFDWQNIFLVYNQQHQGNFMNMRYTLSTNLYLIIYGDTLSDFMVTIRFRDTIDCFAQCRNGGVCVQGECQCEQNYIGFDCSIEVIDGQDASKFSPETIYSFDISMKNELTLVFNSYTSYSLQCLADNPYVKRGYKINMNALTISPSQSLQCQQTTNRVRSYFQIDLVPQYIFVPFSQTSISQTSSGNTSEKTTIYATSTIGAVVLFVGIYCCLKCRKTPPMHNDQLTIPMNKKIALARQINRYMPPQKYQDVILKFPGLADENMCQICLENFDEKMYVRMTYCTHIFHVECIDTWINRNEICPTCRSALNVETYNKIEKTENDDFIIGGGGSTKQILGEHSQRQIRLFGNQRVSGSPIICISHHEK